MNKAKLVKLADEVLNDIEVNMENTFKYHLEIALCEKLACRFRSASYFCADKKKFTSHKDNYESVKPILDDCIDKLLGETK